MSRASSPAALAATSMSQRKQAHRALFALVELVVADRVAGVAERDANVVAVFGVRQAVEHADRRRLAGEVFDDQPVLEARLAVAALHVVVLVDQLAAGAKLRIGAEADDERLAAGDGGDFALADEAAVEIDGDRPGSRSSSLEFFSSASR